MGQVLWHITMSLDGFIAGPRDDMTWLADYTGPNRTADEVVAQIGALLMGERTYQLAKTEEGKPYGGAWTGPQFVLTHHPPKTPPAGFTFLSGDIEGAVATAKAAAGDKYVVVLGANTARSCLDAGCSTRSSCTSHPSCLSVGGVGVKAGAGVPGLAAGACRLREGGSSQAPSSSHGGSPPVGRLQGGWIPVRAPRLISVLGDDSGDMMAMG
jgi:dihydrofolate reductase